MQTYFVDFLILFYKSSNEHNKYMYVIICDFFVVIGRLGGTNERIERLPENFKYISVEVSNKYPCRALPSNVRDGCAWSIFSTTNVALLSQAIFVAGSLLPPCV